LNGYVEMAKLLKERNNKSFDGFVIGKVISSFPDIKIQIDNNIHLDASHLIFSSHLLEEYKREFKINGTSNGESYIAEGNIEFTDSIKVNDLIILVPSSNNQSYVVLDKGVKY
jgi:Protein of unknown function (DUF2577)